MVCGRTNSPTHENMKSSKQIFQLAKVAIPMVLFAILAVQCSSDNTNDDMEANTNDPEWRSAQEANSTNGVGNADVNASGTRTDGVNSMNGTDMTMETDVTTGTIVTPAQERMNATTEVNGLRATLMADLEAVRARLKAGGQKPEMMKADQAKAAELAQGLERVDRTLLAMGEATDATWATMRDAQLKEVAEVREWMKKYKNDEATRAMN